MTWPTNTLLAVDPMTETDCGLDGDHKPSWRSELRTSNRLPAGLQDIGNHPAGSEYWRVAL